MINSLQKLNKSVMIKIALSHLLLGAIAVVFSFSGSNALPVQPTVSPINIITIAVIAKEQQLITNTELQALSQLYNNVAIKSIKPIYVNLSSNKVIRLSPHNGIRAGPEITV